MEQPAGEPQGSETVQVFNKRPTFLEAKNHDVFYPICFLLYFTGGAVPWAVSAWVARGLCTLVWGLLSARVWVVSVAALPAALDRDLSQCGGPPKVASSAPQVSLPSHASLVTASVCVGVSVCLRAYV